jgi:hypothetical protein
VVDVVEDGGVPPGGMHYMSSRRGMNVVNKTALSFVLKGLTIEVLTQMSLQFKKVLALRMALALKPYLLPMLAQVSPATEVYLLTQEGAGVEEVVLLVLVVEEEGGVPPGGIHYIRRRKANKIW